MKNDIKVGDTVYFLYATHLEKGVAAKINKKTIRVTYTTWGWDGQKGIDVERFKLVTHNRVVNAKDEFTVVCEVDIGVEGRCYITYDEFPQHNAIGSNWSQPYMYVRK